MAHTLLCKISIAERIKEYRSQMKLTQSEFGEMLGVSAQAVFKWERSICYPDITLLPRLAEIIGCTVSDFFDS